MLLHIFINLHNRLMVSVVYCDRITKRPKLKSGFLPMFDIPTVCLQKKKKTFCTHFSMSIQKQMDIQVLLDPEENTFHYTSVLSRG